MKFKYLLAPLLIIITHHTFSCDFLEEGEREADEIRQITRALPCFLEDLPDEILLIVFSFFNQKDIPSATSTCKRWQRLMDDNNLWRVYAKRACISKDENSISQDKSYKAILKFYSTLSFTDLDTLNGGDESFSEGISADGLTIVGYGKDGTTQNQWRAFRWTQETGMISLGTLNKGIGSSAKGVSADGAVIIGSAKDGSLCNQFKALRWDQEIGMISLDAFDKRIASWAHGISADGSVIVGYRGDFSNRSQWRAFRWTQETGMVSLGTLNEGAGSWANGISADGLVGIGAADKDATSNRPSAFQWTVAEGMKSLGKLNHGELGGWAYGVNSDGSVIVGKAKDGQAHNQFRAYRWTQETGMVALRALNDLNKEKESCAYGVSADGAVIVGTVCVTVPRVEWKAFRWTAETGMVCIEEMLADKGLLPRNWRLSNVSAITPNGIVLTGQAHYKIPKKKGPPKTLIRSWRAVIPRGNLF